MEAIGGQGANSAGKILAEAAVLGMGYSGNHYSSFGSEKRGTPVRSFVRISTLGSHVRNASAIRHPQLLVIFHESLLATQPEILEGLSDETDVVLNTAKRAKDVTFPDGTRMRSLTVVDVTSLMRSHSLFSSSLNAAMLGACVPVLPEVSKDVLEQYFLRFFSRMSEIEKSKNRTVFRDAIGVADPRIPKSIQLKGARPESLASVLPRLGYANAPIGGLIVNPGNSVLKDLSASRKGTVPRLDRDLCFHCGFCDMVCPDYCFSWETAPDGSAKLKGIDYQYCKGCQKCVVACPVDALKVVPESEIPESDRQVHLFPEIRKMNHGE